MISNIFTLDKLYFQISDLVDRVQQSKRALNIRHCLLYLYTYGVVLDKLEKNRNATVVTSSTSKKFYRRKKIELGIFSKINEDQRFIVYCMYKIHRGSERHNFRA